MTKFNKQVSVAAITLLVAGASVFGVVNNRAFAEDSNGQTTLIQKLAQKFNLDQAEVQAVFDEEHDARAKEMDVKQTEYLNQLVSDGKITEAQKQLLIQKQTEMRANRPDREAMENLTPDERKSQMEAKKAELDAWAKENGIDPQYIMGSRGRGMHSGANDATPAN